MVKGLDRFRAHFADYTEQYVLIGGAACTLAMEEVGEEFRATKDLDIVLCVEALSPEFQQAFWEFIELGGYKTQERSTGKRQFYRFQKPADKTYPAMLELFSRKPEALTLKPDSHLTPIPTEEAISSLSAILMDEDYYAFLRSGRRLVDGVMIAGAEHLTPLKVRAWLDLTRRQELGETVQQRDLKKHKRDVFRLVPIIDPERIGDPPEMVKNGRRANFLSHTRYRDACIGILPWRFFRVEEAWFRRAVH